MQPDPTRQLSVRERLGGVEATRAPSGESLSQLEHCLVVEEGEGDTVESLSRIDPDGVVPDDEDVGDVGSAA